MFLKLKDSYLKSNFQLENKEELLKIYSCGPTVYNYQSIGNMRAVWLPDTIVKLAQILGYQTQWALNITDVGHLVSDGDDGEDKIEKGAKRDNKTPREIVQHYTQDFQKQCQALNFNLPEGNENPKATDYILEQILLSANLLLDNKAYVLEDGIYFSFQKSLPDLSNLAKKYPLLKAILEKIDKQNQGNNSQFTGREIKNTQKDSQDFALWKFVPAQTLQKWKFADFSLVNNLLENTDYQDLSNLWGCPGWHSECVCMIAGVFDSNFSETKDFSTLASCPQTITLHTGGEDHIEIHHKNEILQSFALGFNLSKHWVHNRFVTVDGKKMSKSLGNVFLVTGNKSETGFDSIQEKGFDTLSYRLMLMETKYDEKLDFTWKKLEQSQTRLYNLRKESGKILALLENSVDGDVEIYLKDIQSSEKYTELLETLADNLNIPKFLEIYQNLLTQTSNQVQEIIQKKQIISAEDDFETFVNITVLGFLETRFLQLNLFLVPEEEIFTLADQRQQAKQDKNYTLADNLRNQILAEGWQVDDLAFNKYSLWKINK